MDLSKTNPKTIAALIINGKRELGEVPLSQRDAVALEMEKIKKAALELKKKKKKTTKKKKKESKK